MCNQLLNLFSSCQLLEIIISIFLSKGPSAFSRSYAGNWEVARHKVCTSLISMLKERFQDVRKEKVYFRY